MADNKNTPAFPVLEQSNVGGHMVLECTAAGVTKLEFFACNAPVDIPGWFKHTPPDMEVTKRPCCDGMISEDIDILQCWHDTDDVTGEGLPNHLKWYAIQFTLYNQEQAEYNKLNQQERYFQWRKFYAEQLLLTLEA